MSENDLPKWSEIPGMIVSHPMGLLIGIIVACLLLICSGIFGCLFWILVRLPFNLTSPEKILAGGICDPDKMIKIRFAEGVLNLFQYEWFIWTILISGAIIYFYFQIKKKD